MDRDWLLIGAIAVLAVRDALALAPRPRLALLFTIVVLGVGLIAGAAAAQLSSAEADEWLTNPAVYGGALLVHVALALWSLTRSTTTPRAGRPELLPSPVFAISLILISRLILERTNALSGLETGGLVSISYLIVVAVSAAGLRNIADKLPTTKLAAASHFTAILLVPSSGFSTAGVAEQVPISATSDWRAAIGIAVFLAISFAWHRYRSRAATLSKSR